VRRFAGDHAREVIVVAESGVAAPADRSSRLAGRRARRAAPRPAAPAAVPVTRVTVVDARPLLEPGSAWLARAAHEPAVVADAARTLVRLVAASRIAAACPFPDPDLAAALTTRVGYGSGAQVAAGEWESAVTLPAGGRSRGARRSAAAPEAERLAALLAGRDVALACEELTLRARADVDAGRWREAALQLEAALGAALTELSAWREQRDIAARLDELAGFVDPVARAAAAARAGTLEPAQTAALREGLARLEAALRARAVAAS
jgi:hypothetical protein